MNNKPVQLYLIGGITGLLGGLLMVISSGLVLFRVQAAYLGTPEQKMAFIASHPLVGVTHGIGVASLILIVSTVIALFVLLRTVATARSFLGTGFALLWLCIEMVEHLSQTAPLRALSQLYNDPLNREMAMSIHNVLDEFWEAFSRTGAFLSALMFLCYGLALMKGGNRVSGYLFLIAVIALPIGLVIPGVGLQLHVVVRGLAYFIVSVSLIKIATAKEE
ncbi:hypothetical protein HYR99_35395 [Candidatus Poribacteria bacterium]|nr:hypothetical protein [Candidatus Poribacteria bacterium]